MMQANTVVTPKGSPHGSGVALVRLEEVGIKYRLLTDRDMTLKGRVLNAFSGRSSSDCAFWALRDISLECHQGEVIGIIGANGSGKTTLLRTVARILYPTEGRVFSQGEIRPLLDLGSTMSGYLTGRENSFLYGALNRIPRAKMEELIPRIVDFVELGTFFDVPVRTYSSGMLARLSFALATQTQPDVLLIDEVLSVGDEHFQRKSYFRMMRLIEQGSMVMIVSHNLPFVEQVCTRAILLSSGRIVADGRPSDVAARYKRQIR
jgi:ABC-2 type transport system ATP-binding protein